MYKITRGFCALVLTVFSAVAIAAESPLTKQEITNYIESLKEMQSLSEQISAEGTESATAMAQLWLQGDTQEITQHLKTKAYYDELQAAIKEAGFDSTSEWVDTAQRVTQAFMAVELGDQGENVAAQMEAGLEQIRGSEQLSEEQKAALTEQLKASQKQLARVEQVSQADREAVKPYMEELRRQFEAEQQQAGR
jgi:hypothetical protein